MVKNLLLKGLMGAIDSFIKNNSTDKSEPTFERLQAEEPSDFWAKKENSVEYNIIMPPLKSIPNVEPEHVTESHYNFYDLSIGYLKNHLANGVPDVNAPSPGVTESGRDPGYVAGIVVAVISGVIVLAALIAAVMYRHYLHRNVTSMNFDNPVYRKTTEDQITLEKNGYAPGGKLYPSTIGEEAQEPLNAPTTNDFV